MMSQTCTEIINDYQKDALFHILNIFYIPGLSNKIKFLIYTIRNAITFPNFRYPKFFIKIDGYWFLCRENSEDVWIVGKGFERRILKFLKKKKGKIFIDIGAHIGRYSILLSRNFKKIIAIEPEPSNFKQLVINIRLNKLDDKIVPLNVAVGDKEGYIKISSCGSFSSAVKMRKKMITVKIKPLEKIVKELSISPDEIDLIKIDVEGFEYHVIKGAEKILRNKPLLVIEIWKENLPKVLSLLKEYYSNFRKIYTDTYIFF